MVAVNDAYRLVPFAEILYGCDSRWWEVQYSHPDYAEHIRAFRGEKWSSHDVRHNNKQIIAERYGLRLVQGRNADGFSLEPNVIHYGGNSGFQAINLALLLGAKRVILIGFDMRDVGGRRHFFGNHPCGLRNVGKYQRFIPAFTKAAQRLAKGIEIINGTPDSALKCFPMRPLDQIL